MPSIPRPTLRAALDQQGGRCFYCGRALAMTVLGRSKQARNAATADHLTPLQLGGTEALWNIVAACWPCNREKGGRRPTKMELRRKERITREAEIRDTDPLVMFRGLPCRRSRLLEQLARARRNTTITEGDALAEIRRLASDIESALGIDRLSLPV